MAARGMGRGSVYQRASDRRWIGAITHEGRTVTFSSKVREDAEAKLDAWIAEHLPHMVARPVRRSRALLMEQARAIATHTEAEWWAKVRAGDKVCTYCRRPWRNLHKDHVIPVSRGGSDGLDNVVPACSECNFTKHDMTGDEFTAWATETGFFTKPRRPLARRNGRLVLAPRRPSWSTA